MAVDNIHTREFWLKTDKGKSFVRVSYTFNQSDDIYSLIKHFNDERWKIPVAKEDNIELYLVPWDPNNKNVPGVNIYTNLSKLIKLETRMSITDDLSNKPLIQALNGNDDTAISVKFNSGIPSGALLYATLPDVEAAGGSSSSSSSSSSSAAASNAPLGCGGNLVKEVPDPSTLTGNDPSFVIGIGIDKNYPRVRDGRMFSPWAPLPVVHHCFGKFLDIITGKGTIDEGMIPIAVEMMKSMSKFYKLENDRTEAFLQVLRKALGQTGIERIHYSSTNKNTDGSLRCKGRLVLNVEMKQEGNPSMQNEGYAIDVSGITFDQQNYCVCSTAHLEIEPQLPCLLVDIHGGTIMVVRGAYFAPPSVVFSTLATASMVTDDLQGPSLLHFVKVLQALKTATGILFESYNSVGDTLATMRMPDIFSSAGVIRPVMFGKRHAVCIDTLMEDRLAFTAMCEDGLACIPENDHTELLKEEWPELFVLKFARGRYGINQHKVAAELGHAPQLLGYREIPGGFFCVAMERLDDTWVMYDSSSSTDDVIAAVLEAYKKVFKDKNFVHGDLRPGNILVRTLVDEDGKIEVMFLDFDWAGNVGETKYPIAINQNEWSIRGLSNLAGSLIKTEHDETMLSFKNEQPKNIFCGRKRKRNDDEQ